MSRKTTQLNIDHIIELATATDMTHKQIADIVGVSVYTVGRICRKTFGDGRLLSELSDSVKCSIISAFNEGVGISGIARHLGIKATPYAINKIIQSHGLKGRGRSAQQKARMDRASPEEIANLTKRAHAASKGRVVSHSSKVKRAKTMEGSFNKRSVYERIIYDLIVDFFPNAIPSKAIDVYNLDIGIGNVAVEVFGGGWSYSDKGRIAKYIKRTKELGKLGVNTLFIVIPKETTIIDTKKLVESINTLSSNPPSSSEYRVIWGDSYGSAGLCSDINDVAFVCPFINVRDVTTGRYISIPR